MKRVEPVLVSHLFPALHAELLSRLRGLRDEDRVAREYTERWHHQQQIRDAVGALGLTGRPWLYPVLERFLRGLL